MKPILRRVFPLLVLPFVAALLPACIIDGSDLYDDDDYDYGYRRDRRYYDDRYYDDRHHPGHRPDDRYDRDRRGDRRAPPDSGDFQAGGGAKEFPFAAGHRRCTITVTDGSVGFRTVVVRRGGAKQSVTVNQTFPRGQSFDVPIDDRATGLRISDTGRGRYRVSVR